MKPQNDEWVIGVIGGSGLYQVDGLTNIEQISVESPFGEPSDDITLGEISGHKFLFLPRHGKGHVYAPSDINYRANIDALKRAGATDILAISAVGSLNGAMKPGDFVMADQFIDRTKGRISSFFGKGCVAHISLADPVCPSLSDAAGKAAQKTDVTVHKGGTYLAMEGPQFSTRAESHLYRQWGADIIGMTAMPEVKLAREAELPYAIMAMVTDFDCWLEEEEAVNVAQVVKIMKQNADKAREALLHFAQSLPPKRPFNPIDHALDHALITDMAHRDPVLCAKLDAIAGRVL